MIKYCTKCLYADTHPLGIVINENGICSGCEVHSEKYTLDWKDRLERLKKITNRYKSNFNNYDCIIPVTGGGDSYYIVHVVKNILKLNPLLVTYNNYYNSPLGIRNLANLRIKFDCDILFKNVNPISVKKITRYTLRKFHSLYWQSLAGQTVYPLHVAENLEIPLIIWGAHQGNEQVGMFKHEQEVEMTRRYRKDHDLMGYEAEDLLSAENDLTYDDIHEYIYPTDKSINRIGIRGIYLSNFIPWDPKKQHEKMIKLYNYNTCEFNRTFENYDHTNCNVYMNIHDYIKICKNGYSKVTDHASREIRHKRLDRNFAIRLVKKYELKNFKGKNLFNKWIGIKDANEDFFYDKIKNNKFWIRRGVKEYKFNGLSKKLKNRDIAKKTKKIFYIKNSKINLNLKPQFIIFGKGI
jgi:N-acetyl sugar amidotransferase